MEMTSPRHPEVEYPSPFYYSICCSSLLTIPQPPQFIYLPATGIKYLQKSRNIKRLTVLIKNSSSCKIYYSMLYYLKLILQGDVMYSTETINVQTFGSYKYLHGEFDNIKISFSDSNRTESKKNGVYKKHTHIHWNKTSENMCDRVSY